MQFGFPMNQMNQMNPMNQMNNNMNQMNNNNNMIQMNNNMIQMNNNMNQMNNMNQTNNCQPMNGIKNYSDNKEYSYANCILIALSSLNIIKEWFKKLNKNYINNNPHLIITKEFYGLLDCLYSGGKGDSSNIIFRFNSKMEKMNKNIETNADPYHFLYYFLDFIHSENNIMINPNFDKSQVDNPSIQNMKNDKYMNNLFSCFFQQTQNSIVSQSFFNIEKNIYKCQNCDPLNPLYFYSIRKMFVFEVDKYRIFRDQYDASKIGTRLSLDECFKCYNGEYPIECSECHQLKAISCKQIYLTTKVLIIYFKRNNHSFIGDIHITNILNIFSEKTYELKACISYCNIPKYFADVSINGIWYRYMDDQIKIINDINKEILEYEPQLLIYTLKENNNNRMFYQNNNVNNNNNSHIFVNPSNYNTNNMMANRQNFNTFNYQQFQNQQMLIKQQQQQQLLNTWQQQQNLILMNTMAKALMEKALMEQMNANNNKVLNYDDNNNNNQNVSPSNISLQFIIVPKNWDKTENSIKTKISAQVTLDYTIQHAINNFYTKLAKPLKAITEFKFNDNILDINSQEKLKNLGINSDSKIYATHSDDFDTLNLP